MDDDQGRGAVARDQGRTPAARRPAEVVVGYGRRPRSRRGGQGPRANSCGSAACSGWGGVWTTTEVEARRPKTNGQLLRLGGLQCVGWETANDRSRGAVARDQGPTYVAQGRAVGGLGDEGCPWSRRCGRDQGATPVAQRLAEVKYRYLGRRRYGQDHNKLLHLTGEVGGRKVVTKSVGRRGMGHHTICTGIEWANVSNNSRRGINNAWRGINNSRTYQTIHGGIKYFTEGQK